MPEGDTIFRLAAALRPLLHGQQVIAARARDPRVAATRLVGGTITAVEPRGKHLLVSLDNGLALHTHLGMSGSWHRYAPGERWLKAPVHAGLVLEVRGSVLVCFKPVLVEVLDEPGLRRDHRLHALGPDLLAETFDASAALERLFAPECHERPLGEALMDQRAVAGIGNVYKSEVLFLERLNPWQTIRDTGQDRMAAVLGTAERLLRANVAPGRGIRQTTDGTPAARRSRLWVYGRTGRACLRCRSRIASRFQGEPPRRTYWCPTCQR